MLIGSILSCTALKMMLPKFGFLVILATFSAAFAENSSSSEDSALDSKEAEALLHFVRGVINVGYEADKLSTIAEAASTLQEDADTVNITLVGTQNIYNADGNLKEIRTVELFLPQVEDNSLKLQKSEDLAFDAKDYEGIKEIREIIQAVSYLGVDLELTYRGQESDIYLCKNLLAAKYEGIVYVNGTVNVDTVDEAKVDFEKRNVRSGPVPSAHLAFDVDGKFVKEESTVEPSQLVAVTSDYNEPSGEIIAASLESLAYAFLESQERNEVPEALRKRLSEAYPDVWFTVVADEVSGAYWNKDYSVQLSYDFLDTEDSLVYTVYGYNATTA